MNDGKPNEQELEPIKKAIKTLVEQLSNSPIEEIVLVINPLSFDISIVGNGKQAKQMDINGHWVLLRLPLESIETTACGLFDVDMSTLPKSSGQTLVGKDSPPVDTPQNSSGQTLVGKDSKERNPA